MSLADGFESKTDRRFSVWKTSWSFSKALNSINSLDEVPSILASSPMMFDTSFSKDLFFDHLGQGHVIVPTERYNSQLPTSKWASRITNYLVRNRPNKAGGKEIISYLEDIFQDSLNEFLSDVSPDLDRKVLEDLKKHPIFSGYQYKSHRNYQYRHISEIIIYTLFALSNCNSKVVNIYLNPSSPELLDKFFDIEFIHYIASLDRRQIQYWHIEYNAKKQYRPLVDALYAFHSDRLGLSEREIKSISEKFRSINKERWGLAGNNVDSFYSAAVVLDRIDQDVIAAFSETAPQGDEYIPDPLQSVDEFIFTANGLEISQDAADALLSRDEVQKKLDIANAAFKNFDQVTRGLDNTNYYLVGRFVPAIAAILDADLDSVDVTNVSALVGPMKRFLKAARTDEMIDQKAETPEFVPIRRARLSQLEWMVSSLEEFANSTLRYEYFLKEYEFHQLNMDDWERNRDAIIDLIDAVDTHSPEISQKINAYVKQLESKEIDLPEYVHVIFALAANITNALFKAIEGTDSYAESASPNTGADQTAWLAFKKSVGEKAATALFLGLGSTGAIAVAKIFGWYSRYAADLGNSLPSMFKAFFALFQSIPL